MNSVTLLALLIFTSTSRAGRTGHSDFIEWVDEHFQNGFVEDEIVFTSQSEDSTQGVPTIEFFQTNVAHTQSLPEENQQRRGGAEEDKSNNEINAGDFAKRTAEDPTAFRIALNEGDVDKLYSHFLIDPLDEHNDKTLLTENDDSTPKRREIKEWRMSDDFFDSNNVPWDVDTYNPRLSQSEYIENGHFMEDKSIEGPSVIVAGDFKDHNTHGKHPQYFQKNYYYNYYPLLNDKKKWNSDEAYALDDPKKRKNPTSNPCKQYLEFLKYAFGTFDDDSEYDETNEEYTEETRDRDSEKTQGGFETKLLGPTFYIDNSGKIFQVNTNGNSIQIAQGIPPDSRTIVISKSIPKTKTVVHEKKIPTTEPSTTQTWRPIKTTQSTTQIPTTQKKQETETPTTPPPTTQWKTERQPVTTTAPPIVVELTTEEIVSTTVDEENFRRMGVALGRKPFTESPTTTTTTTTTPSPRTTTPPENRINIKTVLRIENSTEDKSNEADCKDKMLPCPDTVNITYPLNGYCNRYVSCESGRAIRRTCSDGLHFNIIIRSCDLPHNSFCTYVCPQPNGNFGIPGDCSGYFVCKDSNPEYRMCPPKMHWDLGRGICIFSQFSTCPMKCFSENEVRHYEGDCKAYIVCLNGIPYYHKCPPNTKFDKTNLVCVPDHVSTCVDDPRLLTKTLNPNVLCKDVEMQLNTKSWCRSFLPFDKQKS